MPIKLEVELRRRVWERRENRGVFSDERARALSQVYLIQIS